MDKIREALKGWKTYAVAVVTFATAGLEANGIVIPPWIYLALASFGIAALRAGMPKTKP